MRMNNETEKRLPYPIFFTFPQMYETPLYEMFYFAQVYIN